MSTTPDRRRFQFSLRTMLELITVVCLGFSLWAWGGELVFQTLIAFVGIAMLLIVAGIFLRRWIWILGGMVVAIGILWQLNYYSHHQVHKYKGSEWISQNVPFQVVDSQQRKPVAGAIIQVNSGNDIYQKHRKTVMDVTTVDGTCSIEANLQIHQHYHDALPAYQYDIDPQTYNDFDIQIEAPGYKPFHSTLADYMKSQGPIELRDKEPIIIMLSK
jgi:hypothetical protein